MPATHPVLPTLPLLALLALLPACALLPDSATPQAQAVAVPAGSSAAPREPEGNAVEAAVQRSAAGVATVTPVVRSAPAAGPAANIPYEAIASFLSKPLLVSKAQLRDAPRISLLREEHLAVGAPHSVHLRGLQGTEPGRYAIVRVGEPLHDPHSRELLGYLGVPVGTVLVQHTGQSSEGKLIESRREALAGDLLFPDSSDLRQDFTPQPAPPGVAGQILAVVDGVSMIGQYQVVAVNRGSEHGLQPGHLMDIRWQDHDVGSLMVFKTYPRLSYALTLKLLAPVRVNYPVVSP